MQNLAGERETSLLFVCRKKTLEETDSICGFGFPKSVFWCIVNVAKFMLHSYGRKGCPGVRKNRIWRLYEL